MIDWTASDLRIGVALALSMYFVISGAAKLYIGHRTFLEAVERYELLPYRMAAPLARALPPVEIALGVASLIPATTQAATALMVLVLLVFSAAVGMNLVRGRIHECGCLGDLSPRRISWTIVLQNGLLAFAALSVSTWSEASRVSLMDVVAQEDGWAVAMSAGAAVLLMLLWNQVEATVGAYTQFNNSLSEPLDLLDGASRG